MKNKSNEAYRSWFCVLNNPQKQFGEISPVEIVNKAIELWTNDKPTRTCAINYEIGDSGTPHLHMVLEDSSKVRFSAIKKLYPTVHAEITRGSKEQAMDYIQKVGRFEEKNHTVIVPAVFNGDIKANRGSRKDLEIIQDLLEQGKTPNQIFALSLSFRKYEKMVKAQYMQNKYDNMPETRPIKVIWHVGESGTGKSYAYIKLCKEYGKEKIYRLSDYENGGFDNYMGEEILFMDEFKGNITFTLLLQLLDVYVSQVHCRYTNTYTLWNEVHISSIYAPEDIFNKMVSEDIKHLDKVKQLLRRITKHVYHYIENNEYKTFELNSSEYINYPDLISKAHNNNGFIPIEDDEIPKGLIT